MPLKKDVEGRCQICDDAGHGYHFGVIACRACAAFFRRTVALNLKYKCRFDGGCAISKSMRCMCRKCRHNKCLAVGMKPDAVQLNRDAIGHMPHRERTTVIVQNSPSPSSGYSSVSPDLPPITQEMLIARVNEIFNQALLCGNRNTIGSVLDGMLQGYHEIQSMREHVHADSQTIESTGTETDEEEFQRILSNVKIFRKMTVAEVELTARMVTHFRPFMELPADQRMLLFKRFWPHFLKLERAYATYLKLGPDINDERTVLHNGCITHNKAFISVLSQLSKLTVNELNRFFTSSHETSRFFVSIPLKILRPTEFEFIAMCGHLLWTTPGLKGITPETIQIARDTRMEIYTALHRYYIEIANLPVYAPRIGEFMSLLSAVEKSVSQRKEDTMILDFFDLFKVDLKFSELWK